MIVRIAGVVLPQQKHTSIALTAIYGIGRVRALWICNEFNVATIKVFDLTEEQINKLSKAVSKYLIEGDLRRKVAMNIRRLMEIKCFRGSRHRKNLPVRGQRTKTNARTRKGKNRKAKKK